MRVPLPALRAPRPVRRTSPGPDTTAFSGPRSDGNCPSETIPLPSVVVIVPVRNERGRILECLGRLRAQSYPKECLEVLVVDGGSRV